MSLLSGREAVSQTNSVSVFSIPFLLVPNYASLLLMPLLLFQTFWSGDIRSTFSSCECEGSLDSEKVHLKEATHLVSTGWRKYWFNVESGHPIPPWIFTIQEKSEHCSNKKRQCNRTIAAKIRFWRQQCRWSPSCSQICRINCTEQKYCTLEDSKKTRNQTEFNEFLHSETIQVNMKMTRFPGVSSVRLRVVTITLKSKVGDRLSYKFATACFVSEYYRSWRMIF